MLDAPAAPMMLGLSLYSECVHCRTCSIECGKARQSKHLQMSSCMHAVCIPSRSLPRERCDDVTMSHMLVVKEEEEERTTMLDNPLGTAAAPTIIGMSLYNQYPGTKDRKA